MHLKLKLMVSHFVVSAQQLSVICKKFTYNIVEFIEHLTDE